MADDATIAADLIGSSLFQRVKATIGPDGTNTGDWSGRLVDGSATTAAGYVDPRFKVVRLQATPTVSAATYAAGNAVGGLLTFANAVRAAGGTGRIRSVTVLDKANNAANLAAYELVLFDRTFTAATDHAAFGVSDSDMANCLGVLEMAATTSAHVYGANTLSVWPEDVGGSGFPIVLNGTDLFAQLVTRAATVLASTSDITISVTVAQD